MKRTKMISPSRLRHERLNLGMYVCLGYIPMTRR